MKNKSKILIIDDDQDTRLFIGNILENEGYAALFAATGEEGFQMATDESPAAIILNIALPDNAGATVYRKLRKNDKLKNIPVILESSLTERTFSRLRESAGFPRKKGTNGEITYFEKPPEAEELLALIQSYVSDAADGSQDKTDLQANKTPERKGSMFAQNENNAKGSKIRPICPAKKRGCSCP